MRNRQRYSRAGQDGRGNFRERRDETYEMKHDEERISGRYQRGSGHAASAVPISLYFRDNPGLSGICWDWLGQIHVRLRQGYGDIQAGVGF